MISFLDYVFPDGRNDTYFYPDSSEINKSHFYVKMFIDNSVYTINGFRKISPTLRVKLIDPTGIYDKFFETSLDFHIINNYAKLYTGSSAIFFHIQQL